MLRGEVARKLGLAERVATCLHDPGADKNVRHAIAGMIRFHGYAIAGGYEVGASIRWETATGTVRLVRIRKNGLGFRAAGEINAQSGINTLHAVATLDVLEAGDYLEVVVRQNSGYDLLPSTGTGTATDIIVQSAIYNIHNTGTPFPITTPPIGQRYNVNLPIANPAGQFALAILDSDFLVDLELSALQAEGVGQIISTPRIITANQKEGRIEQGVEVPYQESSSSGATTTQFKEAVLSLTVTPQVTPDNSIIMDLFVTKDSVGELVASATGGFVPSIDTRSVVTTVLVKDGQTVVLGGIFETEERETINKVPVLGDIPVLGYLFRSTVVVNNQAELLIFVTPRILREGASLY